MMVLSLLPEASLLPSGLKATLPHSVDPPEAAPEAFRVVTSQSMMVLSSLAEARILPSGLKATLFTCDLNVRSRLTQWLPGGHIPEDDVLSRFPEARVLPSGLKATLYTCSLARSKVRPGGALWTLQRMILPSAPGSHYAIGAESHASDPISVGGQEWTQGCLVGTIRQANGVFPASRG